ncbi:uncharacterized protein [Littorina saxatilis]|uniref:Protein kinase domain-containing protein n=1 Tax=Littorina saxatilis TaxID=31220 RepID=A0AAN9G0L9_9CAEN
MRPAKRGKKRKMDALIGGDNSTAHDSCPSTAKAPCLLSQAGTASGDSQIGAVHKFVTLVRDLEPRDGDGEKTSCPEGEGPPPEVHSLLCDLDDVWSQQYPPPLSSLPSKPIKTGNKSYDAILPDLPALGYRPLNLIAKGRSGTLLLAQDIRESTCRRDSECKPVAIKLQSGRKRKQPANLRKDITEEMLIHQRLQHSSVVSLLTTISYQGRLGLVLEFCDSGNLEQLLRAHSACFIPESVARRYLSHLHAALEYVHLSGVAHRDLCPANILVSADNTLKLADFGHAAYYRTGDPLSEDYCCGTPGYQAPELVMKTPYDPRGGDLWGLGSVLYVMVVGRLPHGRIKDEQEARSLRPLQFPEPHVLVLSREVQELLRGMLAYVPSARYTLNRLKNSSWMEKREEKVQLGNYYLVRNPQKVCDGDRERQLKAEYGI